MISLLKVGIIVVSGLSLNVAPVNPTLYTDVTSSVVETPSSETSTDVIIDETEEEESFDFGKWMEEHFTAETIATIMSVLTMLGVVLKLCASLKELAQKKAITTEEVCNKVSEILKTTNKESVEKSINDLVKPLEDKVGSITPVLNAFAKVLALSQENTPESRLAILELLQSIGNISDKVIDDAKKEVNSQIKQDEEKKETAISTLEKIELKSDSEGRY